MLNKYTYVVGENVKIYNFYNHKLQRQNQVQTITCDYTESFLIKSTAKLDSTIQ